MIAILGGGISGLTAAFKLKKAGKAFILLEGGGSLGGKIKSSQHNDYTVEHGPNTVLVNNGEIKKLIEDLGMWDQLIFPDETASSNRFVLKNNKIEPFPSGLGKAVKSKLFSIRTLISILKEPFQKPNTNEADESLADFVERRLGKQILEDFITPFVTGIYAGDPKKMSVNYTMSLLKEAEDAHGSIIKGMMKIMKAKKLESERLGLPKQKIFTFKNGLQDLINTLHSKIESEVELNSRINKVELNSVGYLVKYEQGGIEKEIACEQVISALPAFSLAEVTHNFAFGLSSNLSRIKYVPALAVHLGFKSSQMKWKEKAFGILSRNEENVPFLGVLFNSHFFPHTAENGKELISVICGGYRYPEIIDKTDKEVFDEVTTCLRDLLGITGDFDFQNIVRWGKGIPQYELGYGKIEKEIDLFLGAHHNFRITANFYKGISVSDCVKNASLVAQSLL